MSELKLFKLPGKPTDNETRKRQTCKSKLKQPSKQKNKQTVGNTAESNRPGPATDPPGSRVQNTQPRTHHAKRHPDIPSHQRLFTQCSPPHGRESSPETSRVHHPVPASRNRRQEVQRNATKQRPRATQPDTQHNLSPQRFENTRT